MKPHGAPRRPAIGLTPDFAASPVPLLSLKQAYCDAVSRAGGLPFVLPLTEDRSVVEAALDRVSGVVITGGAFDIPPDHYGEAPQPGLGELNPPRTAFEMAVLRLALARKMPVLGVCGGMQLVNVCLGGTLVQDIATQLPQARAHQQTHDRAQPQHPVEVKDGTCLAESVGKGQLMVNSTHHQAVKSLGAGLVVSAVAPDGVVEGVETADGLVMAVQWHPELMLDTVPMNLAVYRHLVSRARLRHDR